MQLSQQGYANFPHNQRLSKITSPRILGGWVNQTDVSNANNIFTPPSIPVNLEEDQPAVERVYSRKVSLL